MTSRKLLLCCFSAVSVQHKRFTAPARWKTQRYFFYGYTTQKQHQWSLLVNLRIDKINDLLRGWKVRGSGPGRIEAYQRPTVDWRILSLCAAERARHKGGKANSQQPSTMFLLRKGRRKWGIDTVRLRFNCSFLQLSSALVAQRRLSRDLLNSWHPD